MKKLSLATAALVALSVFTPFATAQIVTRTIDVWGAADGVESHPFTRVLVSADADLNTYTVTFSNTLLGSNGFVGTITSFGFNTPFTSLALSSVSFTSTKPVAPTQHGWGLFNPYGLSQQGGIYAQDLGAGVGNVPEGGNPKNGIKFGEEATFVFTLPDFDSADGFFDKSIDFTVRWQQVGAASAEEKFRGGSDFGGGNDIPSEIPVPTPVPEPSTYGIFAALGLLGFAIRRRFRK